MVEHLNKAVDAAGPMVRNHRIDDSQIPTIRRCFFDGSKGRAKCNVYEEFGLTLHASQDFYSHTNWVDRPRGGRTSVDHQSAGTGQDRPRAMAGSARRQSVSVWSDVRLL